MPDIYTLLQYVVLTCWAFLGDEAREMGEGAVSCGEALPSLAVRAALLTDSRDELYENVEVRQTVSHNEGSVKETPSWEN